MIRRSHLESKSHSFQLIVCSALLTLWCCEVIKDQVESYDAHRDG